MDYLLRRSFHNRLGQSVNKQSCVLDYHSHSPFAAMELFDYLSSMCEAFWNLGKEKNIFAHHQKLTTREHYFRDLRQDIT